MYRETLVFLVNIDTRASGSFRRFRNIGARPFQPLSFSSALVHSCGNSDCRRTSSLINLYGRKYEHWWWTYQDSGRIVEFLETTPVVSAAR